MLPKWQNFAKYGHTEGETDGIGGDDGGKEVDAIKRYAPFYRVSYWKGTQRILILNLLFWCRAHILP